MKYGVYLNPYLKRKKRMYVKKSKKQIKELFSRSDWNYDTIAYADEITAKIGKEYLKLDIYPNQIEIISSEQMLDVYSLIGLPISYNHWSFGKSYMQNSNNYKQGRQGLAYEMVINSNPCISYNMEDNSTCLMVLVLAHAAQGHNHFFKNNYMFKQWTDADHIIDYMKFAKKFVSDCEDRYGPEDVEDVLDACHSIMDYGVDKYKKPPKLSVEKEKKRLKKRLKAKEENYNPLWKTIPKEFDIKNYIKQKGKKIPKQPEENILYFLEKHAPLPIWKKELIRIVRKVSQYFYPQGQTKVCNEATACFAHYHIVQKMYDEGYVDDGFMLEFFKYHSGVLYQPPYNSKYYSQINPYTLGFNIWMDVKRMCQNPTAEDKQWFPNVAGKDWIETFHHMVDDYRDDSAVLQFLSPKVMRDMKLFTISDDEDKDKYIISSIHNERGYKDVRQKLSRRYERDFYVPDIQIIKADTRTDRRLVLYHDLRNGIELDEATRDDVMQNLRFLWGAPIKLYSKGYDNQKKFTFTVD